MTTFPQTTHGSTILPFRQAFSLILAPRTNEP
jgi:hypothetical protein